MSGVLLAVRTLVAAWSIAATAASGAAPVAFTERPYIPPIDRPVVDGFRAPEHAYGPGNRGLEYASVEGDPVVAIGAGVVTFAGRIAEWHHVTVQHPDGRRSSYSRLVALDVVRGQSVERGRLVGRAGDAFHLGLRLGDTYLDPAPFIGEPTGPVRLVPIPN